MAAFLQGRWDRAVAVALRGMEEAIAAGHRHNEYYASIWEGAALAVAGDAGAGLAALARTAGLALESHIWIMLDWVYAYRSFAYLYSGNFESAREAAVEGLRIAERNGFRLGVALCTEALGRPAAAGGDLASGHEMLQQALRLYDAIGSRPYFNQCRSFLSRVCKIDVRSS